MQEIHDRMPVILTEASETIWLNPSIKDNKQLQEILKPYDKPVTIYPVSKKVNSSTYNEFDAIRNISNT